MITFIYFISKINILLITDPERSCFIEPISEEENKRPKRIAAFDFETTQDLELENGLLEHRVNCISLRWICTVCADLGYNFNDKTKCSICCPNYDTELVEEEDEAVVRYRYWTAAVYENPLEEFINWILEAWDKKVDTILYAHYGGMFVRFIIDEENYRFERNNYYMFTIFRSFRSSLCTPGTLQEEV